MSDETWRSLRLISCFAILIRLLLLLLLLLLLTIMVAKVMVLHVLLMLLTIVLMSVSKIVAIACWRPSSCIVVGKVSPALVPQVVVIKLVHGLMLDAFDVGKILDLLSQIIVGLTIGLFRFIDRMTVH